MPKVQRWWKYVYKSFMLAVGNYLIRCYVMVKLLYVTNIITQLFLLDAFLGAPFHTYGVDVFRDLFQTNSDRTTQAVVPMRFPHSTMCDLKVHRLGAVHRYSVQCVLPINLFNEKIFLFVWFVASLLLAGISSCYTLFRSAVYLSDICLLFFLHSQPSSHAFELN